MASAVREGVSALYRTVLELLHVQPEHRLEGRVGRDMVAQVQRATIEVGFAETCNGKQSDFYIFTASIRDPYSSC